MSKQTNKASKSSNPISIGFLFLQVCLRGRSEALQKAHWHRVWKENRGDWCAHYIFWHFACWLGLKKFCNN